MENVKVVNHILGWATDIVNIFERGGVQERYESAIII